MHACLSDRPNFAKEIFVSATNNSSHIRENYEKKKTAKIHDDKRESGDKNKDVSKRFDVLSQWSLDGAM